ncbi:MAG: hypothetical protein V3S37_07045, partial [Dehalococcoidia bacterium]
LRDSWHALAGFSDVSLGIALLPFGKDPDELIRTSSETWQRTVAESTSLLDYLFDSVPLRWDLNTSAGKQQAVDELKPVIKRMGNVFEEDKYYRKLADTLGVTLATLETSMGRPQRAVNRRTRRETTPRASATAFEEERHDRPDEHLMALVLQWPDLKGYVRDLDPQTLWHWEDRQVFTNWLECSTMEGLLEGLDEHLRQRVDYLLSITVPPTDLRQRERAVMECSHRLEERRLRNLKSEEALLFQDGEAAESADQWEQRVVETNESLRRLFHAKSGHPSRGEWSKE